MCSICGGNLCLGSGVCGVVAQTTTESIKIVYSNPASTLNYINNFFAALFMSTKDQINNTVQITKQWLNHPEKPIRKK